MPLNKEQCTARPTLIYSNIDELTHVLCHYWFRDSC